MQESPSPPGGVPRTPYSEMHEYELTTKPIVAFVAPRFVLGSKRSLDWYTIHSHDLGAPLVRLQQACEESSGELHAWAGKFAGVSFRLREARRRSGQCDRGA